MEIPESLLFEIIGRKEVANEVYRRQVADLRARLRRAEPPSALAPAGLAEGPDEEVGEDG